jgi:hypothetical protein
LSFVKTIAELNLLNLNSRSSLDFGFLDFTELFGFLVPEQDIVVGLKVISFVR